MKRPEEFSVSTLLEFFDSGSISVEQLNHLVRQLRTAAQEGDTYLSALADIADIVEADFGENTSDAINKTVEAVKSLRAQLKAAQEQDPTYMWRLEDDGWMECTKEFFHAEISAGYEKRIVFAAPIPAQQSPVVAVPENAVAKVVKVTQSKPYHDVECYSWKYEIKVLDHCYKPCPVKEGDLLYLRPSPRITEQDAREIVEDFEEFYYQNGNDYNTIVGALDAWITRDGRALLDKLNEKRE